MELSMSQKEVQALLDVLSDIQSNCLKTETQLIEVTSKLKKKEKSLSEMNKKIKRLEEKLNVKEKICNDMSKKLELTLKEYENFKELSKEVCFFLNVFIIKC